MAVPRRAGSFDERGRRVVERGNLAVQPERFEVLAEPRPAFETVLARDDELRVGQPERPNSNDI
jgi:hypothetical protein